MVGVVSVLYSGITRCPARLCHCATDRRCTPGSLRGSWKNPVDWIYTLRNTASRAAEFSFVRNYIRVWEEEEKGGGNMDHLRGNVSQIVAKYWTNLNNVSAKIHAQKLSPGDTRDNLKRFAQSRERRDGKNNEWNGIRSFFFLFFLLSIPQLHREIDRSTFQPLKSYGCPI